jgi:hypothetical protein
MFFATGMSLKNQGGQGELRVVEKILRKIFLLNKEVHFEFIVESD